MSAWLLLLTSLAGYVLMGLVSLFVWTHWAYVREGNDSMTRGFIHGVFWSWPLFIGLWYPFMVLAWVIERVVFPVCKWLRTYSETHALGDPVVAFTRITAPKNVEVPGRDG